MFLVFLFISLAVVAFANPLFETIEGLGLIGSHFGRPGLNASFDYVVVGGGTAGLTLATRLAQSGKFSIAVIEAGGLYEMDNGNISSIPGDSLFFTGADPVERNPLVDWETFTVPQPGLGGREVLYTQGKTLGGGSARNYMFYHRGTIDSYQKWANEVNDQSYTFNNLLPFFKKSVEFQTPNNDIRPANATPGFSSFSFSTTGGPLKVGYPNWANAFSTWILSSMKELGLKVIPDFTSGSLLGSQYVGMTLDGTTQTRSSSETSFLRLAMQSTTNLVVYKSTMAKRIIFSSSNATHATGVLVNTAGTQYAILANREVIISAGAFRSPQLLMVSGIGNKNLLQSLEIPLVANLPGVGQNMWDHVIFGPSYQVNVITHSAMGVAAFAAKQVANYNTNRTGTLTNIGTEFVGFEKLPASLREGLSEATLSGLATFPADWPEIEILATDAYSGFRLDVLNGAPRDGKNYGTVSAALIAPFSRGNISISSTDTAINPVVNPNWLTDPRDQEVAVAAFKRTRQLFQTQAIRPILIGAEAFPGAAITTDAEILALLQQSANTVFHASATNKMGLKSDSMAVVDTSAKVFGFDNLRVVDASIFPFLPPGHPQATIYALAEKIATDILNGV